MLPDFVGKPNPDIYMSGNGLTLDFETTNKEKGSALDPTNRLLLACWRFQGESYSHWGDEFSMGPLLRHIAVADFIVAHNAKFELQWLARCGADLRRVLPFDTMIAEKVIHANRKIPGRFPLSLESTAARRGLGSKASTVSSLIGAGVCPSDIPAGLLEEYCAQDVSLTERIFLAQRNELQSLGLLPVAYCRNLVTPALADIEQYGMMLDKERVAEACADYFPRFAELEAEFDKLTGGVNFRSGKQMREYFYEKLKFAEVTDVRGNAVKTKAGNAKVDKHTIAALKAETPAQKEFKRLAGDLAKMKVPVQTLRYMMKLCEDNPNDTRMYFQFNQTRTDTDRLSSTGRRGGPQGQNIGRDFKRLFRSGGESSVMCESDGVQLEFRVAAHLGRDKVALSDVVSGLDIHAATASTLGVSRQEAKSRTFRPLYGGKSGTPRERKYIAYFTSRYAGIYGAQTGWTMEAVRDKFIRTECGTRFYFPEAKLSDSGYVAGSTKIFNYPVQALATAEIIPLCVVALWHLSSRWSSSECRIVNTIHDSIVAEVSTGILEEYKQMVRYVFTDWIYGALEALYGIKFTMPLGVGIKAAAFWGDTKDEEKHEAKSYHPM